MMNVAGYCDESYRLPLVELSKENKSSIKSLLKEYGIG